MNFLKENGRISISVYAIVTLCSIMCVRVTQGCKVKAGSTNSNVCPPAPPLLPLPAPAIRGGVFRSRCVKSPGRYPMKLSLFNNRREVFRWPPPPSSRLASVRTEITSVQLKSASQEPSALRAGIVVVVIVVVMSYLNRNSSSQK